MPFEITDAPIPLTAEHDDYDEVRATLMVGLTSTKVSDTYIARDVHQGAAEDEVSSRIENAETLLGNRRVRRAAIYLTAAYICPSMVQILQADANEAMSYRVNQIDWEAKRAQLIAMADAEISAVIEENEGAPRYPRMTHFMRATGGRGKWG